MAIEYVEGDIFRSSSQTIVNTVNCDGVMGKGLALEFKKHYPEMYKEYKTACDRGELKIGIILPPYKETSERWILNFPTKNHWRFKSKLEYIELGLLYFSKKYKEWGITSVAFPKLGCQLGGLSWEDVKPVMVRFLENLPDLKVSIYSYFPKKLEKQRKIKGKRRKLNSLRVPDTQRELTFDS